MLHLNWLRAKFSEEDGMGTIEIVIILAVLVGLAFLFHAFANEFFSSVTDKVKTKSDVDKLFP